MTATDGFLLPADLVDPHTVAQLDTEHGVDGPIAIINLDNLEDLTPHDVTQMRAGHFTFRRVPIGVRTRPLSPSFIGPGQLLLSRMATTLIPYDDSANPADDAGGRHARAALTVRHEDPLAAVETIRANGAANATAALAFDTLLRINATATVREGLIAESFAYSMVLAGADYRRWRADLPPQAPQTTSTPPAEVRRDGNVVTIRIPAQDGGCGLDPEAKATLARELHALGPDVAELRIRTEGPHFWDTDRPEGVLTAEGIASSHLRRMTGSLGVAAYPLRHRITARVPGNCIGTGLELAALANHVTATRDAVFQLPQLGMGLVTGDGGTVTLTRRLGRWRTAYLALSGATIDAATAYRWRLVDQLTNDNR